MKKYMVSEDSHQEIVLTQPGEYTIVLAGPGAEVTIAGTFQSSGNDQLTTKVVIHHRAPHTRATTTLKGAADEKSSITFIGKIIIDEHCGDTNSFLTERILLLSDQARAEAIPELEILSDDVKCSHAASVSNIPEEQLFYLMSRGIERNAAKKLIVDGFLSPA